MASILTNKNHKNLLKKSKKQSTCSSEMKIEQYLEKGTYKLWKGFEKYYVNDFKWGQLTAQRLTKIKDEWKRHEWVKKTKIMKTIQLLLDRPIIYQYHPKILE